ncbi:MAG: response regulator [Simkaniaceae bacterium]|nr:response regulator [Simkaniaceae bacterium]
MSGFQLRKLPTLLLVTGSSEVRLFFEGAIEEVEGYALITVDSSKDAFSVLRRTHITFIVIDEDICAEDPAGMCIRIRKGRDLRFIPVLVITSHLKKSFIRRLRKAGATDFLRRPLDREEFFHKMEMATESRRTQEKMHLLAGSMRQSPSIPGSMKDRIVTGDQAVRSITDMLRRRIAFAVLLVEIDGCDPDRLPVARLQRRIAMFTKDPDLLFTQGPGQFLILFPEQVGQTVHDMAETMRKFFGKKPLRIDKVEKHLTLSIGLVSKEGGVDSGTYDVAKEFDRLMQTAKECLDKAKRRGDTIVSHAIT